MSLSGLEPLFSDWERNALSTASRYQLVIPAAFLDNNNDAEMKVCFDVNIYLFTYILFVCFFDGFTYSIIHDIHVHMKTKSL